MQFTIGELTSEVLHAAFNSLWRLGYEVKIPNRSLCCGRPLYDFGFLQTAKNLLLEILHVLRDDIRSGKPVSDLEPSCASVFRDEMLNLFPNNPDAIRPAGRPYCLANS
jgi:Fe-S oxidoreductase